ncbi:MAG: hypothetical protein OIF57_18550 [Marinobacterium sp.]|nr:hypothetical protein [Marinobacterium sp.]
MTKAPLNNPNKELAATLTRLEGTGSNTSKVNKKTTNNENTKEDISELKSIDNHSVIVASRSRNNPTIRLIIDKITIAERMPDLMLSILKMISQKSRKY